MAAIVLDQVTKEYGQTRAVKGISLSIHDREFVAFLGPSGCGKTTCLRMLAGLVEPSSGRIELGGSDVTYASPRDRDVAMVFQNYALYPHMSVAENMVMGLKYRGVPRPEIERRVLEAAAMLDLVPLLKRRPAELSGGQRQRVALGRAIVRQPKAFLMDEPLSNLDTALRARMRVELKLLHQRVRTTTIYVTHDQIEAMTMADRIAVMNDGQLMQFDTPDRIFNEPANRFVAQFVGAPPINIIGGLLSTAPQPVLRFLGLDVPTAPGSSLSRLEAGRSIEVGIRPQALGREQRPDGIAIRGQVVAIEPIGTQTHVHLAVGDQTIVAVVDPRSSPSVGDITAVSVSRSDLYVFDQASGQTLARGA